MLAEKFFLLLETLKSQSIGGQFIRHEFQSHRPSQSRVFGLIDDTHPAFAKHRNDPVVRNRFPH